MYIFLIFRNFACSIAASQSTRFALNRMYSIRTFLLGAPASIVKRGLQPANCNTSNDHIFTVYKQLNATNAQQQKKQDYNNSSNIQKEKSEKPLCAFTSNNAITTNQYTLILNIYTYTSTHAHTQAHTRCD